MLYFIVLGIMFHHALLGKEQNLKIILDFPVLGLGKVLTCHLVSEHFHLHFSHLHLILEKHDQPQVKCSSQTNFMCMITV